MADLNEASYRREIANFRNKMTRAAETNAGRRTLYGRGAEWYAVLCEPQLRLYCTMNNLYLEAFHTVDGYFKFSRGTDPFGREPYSQPVAAQTLSFLSSYNSNGNTPGLGFMQDQAVTVDLSTLGFALGTLASANFGGKAVDQQRAAVARVVIGLVEAARFSDVENQVVAGTAITDRNWPNHRDQSAVVIEPPGR